ELLTISSLFKASDKAVPNLGVSNYTNWIKFTVFNDSHHAPLVLTVTNPTIDEVTLFTLQKGDTDSSSISEKGVYANRDYYHQFFAFNLHVNRGDSIVCLLKLKSSKQLLVPLSINSSTSFVKELGGFDIRAGIYIGIMLAMLLYNLSLYFSARDRH